MEFNRILSTKLLTTAFFIGLTTAAFFGNAQTVDAMLYLDLDCWGNETSWSLKDWGGNTVYSASAGDYEQSFPDGPGQVQVPMTLDVGECYTFRIVDSQGDGMAGSMYNSCNVDGDYALIANGDTLAQLTTPLFGYSIFKQFCVHLGCTNPVASNYLPSATVNDGSCILPPVVPDFTYEIVKSDCDYVWYAFSNSSSYATDLLWNFENGSPSTSISANPLVKFPSGSNVNVSLLASNDSSEDQTDETIQVPLPDIGSTLTMYLEPDCFASDISWTLADDQGNVIRSAEAGTYTDSYPSFDEVITETFCLPNGCYTFTINDEYGDGMEGSDYWQCNHDGDFYFKDNQGNKIAEMDTEDYGESTSLQVCVDGLFVWVGGSDQSYDEDNNWEGGNAPGNNDDVYIVSPNEPVIIDGNITVRNLIIAEGTTLAFADENDEIKLMGDIINHGNLDLSIGSFNIKGNQPQHIKGSNPPFLADITLNTNDTLHLMCEVGIKGTIDMKKGVFDTNGHLITLLAGDDFQGTIGEIKSNAEFIADSIAMQQYFPAGTGGWRMICSPLSGVTFEQINDDIPTTGFEGSDYPEYPSADNPWANIRYYDETFSEGDEADLNVGFTPIESITDTMDNKLGYFVYFVPSPTTIDMVGLLPQGTIDIDLSYTDSDAPPGNDGWNLVANPYPCTIDWDKGAGYSKVGMSNSIYAYDPATGQYSSYVNGISVGKMDNRIAPGQAFWVKAVGPSGHLRVTESAKTKGHGVSLRTVDADTETTVRIRLSHEDITDECVFGFNHQATEDYDENIDAYKFYPTNSDLPSIAIKSAAQEDALPLSISMMPIPEEGKTIPLEVQTGDLTEMYISNAGVDSFEEDVCLTLEDTELGVMVPMNQGDTYAFEVTQNTTPDRFILHMASSLDITVFDESCPESDDAKIIAQGFGEAPWNFTWTDEMGMVIKETVGATTADELENANPGFYEIEVSNSNEYCSSAVKVVEVKAAPTMELTANGTPATCNQEESAKVFIDLTEHFDWDITIENYHGEIVKTLNGLHSDTLITGLNPEIYTVFAYNICGAEVELSDINLRDANAVQAGMAVNQTTTSLEEGGVIQFSSTSFNADHLLWEFGDGSVDSTSFMPQHAYTEHGNYTATVVASNEFCTDTTSIALTITMGTGPEGNNSGSESLAALEVQQTQDQVQINIGDESIKLEIITEAQEDLHIAIFNMAGQIVIDENAGSTAAENLSVDISSLASGVYTLHISSSTKLMHSESFVKN